MIRTTICLAASAAIVAGCASSENPGVTGAASATSSSAVAAIPTVSGSKATVVAQVDCGEDGVANVEVVFGKIDNKVLVGRNPTTQAIGGSKTFSQLYGMGDGNLDQTFTLGTAPTTGTCKSSITNYDTGEIIAQKESAGRSVLKVVLTGRD